MAGSPIFPATAGQQATVGSIPADPDALMTERQAAGLLSLSIRTMQAWRVRGGGPPYVKLGRAVRYRRRDLAAWLEVRTFAHTTAAAAGPKAEGAP